MHVEIIVEDASGKKLLDILLPRIWGEQGSRHTWRVHGYKGIGRIPKGLADKSDPRKRILLQQLPRLLQGYRRNPDVGAVIVVLDSDDKKCAEFLIELNHVAQECGATSKVMFRLAIEEMEAWYLGDGNAIKKAYPGAAMRDIGRYKQDSICGTWELLADILYPGGFAAVRKKGWPLPGQLKAEWAERIGPLLSVTSNASPSFNKLLEGLNRL